MPDIDQLSVQSHLELDRRIRERAYQIWRSHQHGSPGDTALDDWLQAEREIVGGDSEISAQNRGSTVGSAGAPDMSRVEELGEA